MKLGWLEIGWTQLDESERLNLGLDPRPAGWEAFFIEWHGYGLMLMARPRKERGNG